MKLTGNEPAFPQSIAANEFGIYTAWDAAGSGNYTSGMPIRLQLAALSIPGLVDDLRGTSENFEGYERVRCEVIARKAFKIADALIAEYNKTQE